NHFDLRIGRLLGFDRQRLRGAHADDLDGFQLLDGVFFLLRGIRLRARTRLWLLLVIGGGLALRRGVLRLGSCCEQQRRGDARRKHALAEFHDVPLLARQVMGAKAPGCVEETRYAAVPSPIARRRAEPRMCLSNSQRAAPLTPWRPCSIRRTGTRCRNSRMPPLSRQRCTKRLRCNSLRISGRTPPAR